MSYFGSLDDKKRIENPIINKFIGNNHNGFLS